MSTANLLWMSTNLVGQKGLINSMIRVCLFSSSRNGTGIPFCKDLGFGSGPAATKGLARKIEKALKANGAVTAPKALRPLNKAWKKATTYIEKKKPGYALKELSKIMSMAIDKKKFPNGIPTVAGESQGRI